MVAIILATLIFLVCLWLIFTEKFHRTVVAMGGAVAMLVLGKGWGFYSESDALAAIDFQTLGLLLGMMLLVALLEPTGFFQYLAVLAARWSRGRTVPLLVLLGLVTTLVSMFLDNVTTVVLIAPVTILISEILGVNPTPFLMAEALLSDTGGVATLVGDPPNVLVASAAGFSFVDFLTHALPVVFLAWLLTLFLLWWMFRRELTVVSPNAEALLRLSPSESFHDVKRARRVLIALGVAISLFFFDHALHISPAFIALSTASFALLWTRADISETLRRIEWGVLVFFAALFVMVGGLHACGALGALVRLLERANSLSPVLFGIGLLWLVAVLSAVVDNVPITIALIPVIHGLQTQGMNATPLWWALVFGAGFGGNGTIIGSTANIVVAAISEKTRYPITAKLWNRRGLPIMVATCLLASLLYLLVYPLFE